MTSAKRARPRPGPVLAYPLAALALVLLAAMSWTTPWRWWALAVVALGLGSLALARGAHVASLRKTVDLEVELARALALLDATYDAVLIYDAATRRIRFANRGAMQQLGYSREQLLGMDVLAIKHGLDVDAFTRQFAPLLAGQVESLSFEAVHRRRDGKEVPVEVSARLVRLEDGGAASIATVARDISARKHAEDERDRFFSLSLDMLCISTADGYFKRLSPAFTRTLGWDLEEMLARPLIDFVHPEDQAATLAEVEKQMRDHQPVLDFENRFAHKDGGWRVLSWKSVPQYDGSMYATARDVTERREAEQQIRELNRELESFSYSVSHDLRAPLRHIDGYARILREDLGARLDPESRRCLDTIVDSSRRMGLLIDDLLAFSRLGRKPISTRAVDMRELAKGALAEVQSQVGGAASNVQVQVGELPPADGDPALLRQVWSNLLGNAIKYSSPRGKQARVLVSGERRGDLLHYSVADNGVGFDMRYAEKLFGVFQRLHSQEEFEGTGVGLAIVQRIVARHGGAVAARAEPGQGATFSFELPAVREDG
jgi:PAS domain S-box-containing protein